MWLTSVAVAPVIMLICDYAEKSTHTSTVYSIDSDIAFEYLFIVLFGMLLSLIPYVIFYLIIKITTNCTNSITRIKSIISIAGVALAVTPFAVLFSSTGVDIHDDSFYILIGYCLCIGWFSWFYRLEAEENKFITVTTHISNSTP